MQFSIAAARSGDGTGPALIAVGHWAQKLQDRKKENPVMNLIKRFAVEEEGQGIVEYALIIGLVVLGIWTAVSAGGLGTAISSLFGRVATEVGGCTSGSC